MRNFVSKHIALCVMAMICAISADAQIVKWLQHPNYVEVKPLSCAKGFYVVKDEDGRHKIFDRDENCISIIKKDRDRLEYFDFDSIADYREGYAVMFKGEELRGYIDSNGKIKSIRDYMSRQEGFNNDFKLRIPNNYPYFSCGMLLVEIEYKEIVKEVPVTRRGFFYIADDESPFGTMQGFGIYATAKPFFGDVACVSSYTVKKDETNYALVGKMDGKSLPIVPAPGSDVKDPIPNHDLEFLSSPTDDGRVVLVYKKRFYEYNLRNNMVTLLSTNPADKKKTAVRADDILINVSADGLSYVIAAKNNTANFFFDRFMRPQQWTVGDQVRETYPLSLPQDKPLPPNMMAFEEGGLYGLKTETDTLLPAQFQEIGAMRGNDAVVKLNDKYGVVEYDKDGKFIFELNNNKEVAFQSNVFAANFKLIAPTYISTKGLAVEEKTEGCKLDVSKHRTFTNDLANGIENTHCMLSIPDGINTKELGEFKYRFVVKYEDLRSKEYEVGIQAWYSNSYNVELDESNTYVKGRTLYAHFDISNKPTDLFMEVKAKINGKEVDCVARNDRSYDCHLDSVSYGNIPLEVVLTQRDCPPLTYSFDVSYPEPPASNKTASTKAGAVTKVVTKRKGSPVVGRKTPETPASKRSFDDIF